jgi:hypothetical protein
MLRRGATTGHHHPSPERPVPYRLTGCGSVLARPDAVHGVHAMHSVSVPRSVGCFTVVREAYPGTQTISALGATSARRLRQSPITSPSS